MMKNINPDAKLAMYMSTLKKKDRIKEIKVAETIIKETIIEDNKKKQRQKQKRYFLEELRNYFYYKN
jgi:hypothetical protein